MIDVQIKDETGIDDSNKYPRLMRLKSDHRTVVFFEDYETGYQLCGHGGLIEEGRYWPNWDINLFEDFTGTLELRNV